MEGLFDDLECLPTLICTLVMMTAIIEIMLSFYIRD